LTNALISLSAFKNKWEDDGMNKHWAVITISLAFLISMVAGSVPLINAQSTSNIVISSDGSPSGATSIVRSGNIYTLTANISGNLQVQKSGIVIDGAGYSVNQGGIDLSNGIGQNPTRSTIFNVTIENLYIESGGIGTNGGGNNTFYNDYIPSIQFLGNCINNNITFCTVGAISFDYGGNATMTENNITGNILVWLSNGGIADRNYWSDYLTKYPNATEIDNSGIGNQPYVYAIVETRTPIVYQDNHPLMNPVAVPLGSNPLCTQTPTLTTTQLPTINTGAEPPKTEPLPTMIVGAALLLVVLSVIAGLLVYFKKHKSSLVRNLD
jgi:hypothetical protein